jgi:hypothetical protein
MYLFTIVPQSFLQSQQKERKKIKDIEKHRKIKDKTKKKKKNQEKRMQKKRRGTIKEKSHQVYKKGE